jgi:hypothetical protein
MSNPNDPKPNPDQPDPQKPKEGKPKRTPTGGSSFEFQLPEEGSYSDLPPVPQPELPDATAGRTALPPRPSTVRPSSGSFDFIDLGDVDPNALPAPVVQNLPPAPAPAASVPPPPLLTPIDDALTLPPVVPTAGDSSVTYALPMPTSDPSSFTLGDEVLDLANLPELPDPPTAELRPEELPTAGPMSGVMSVPDISTLYPSSDPPSSFVLGKDVAPVPASTDSSGSFVLPELPVTPETASNAGISGVFPSSAIPTGFGSSVISPEVLAPQTNTDASGSFVLPPVDQTLPEPGAPSTPDISSVLPASGIPTADPGSFVGTPALADLELPMAEPGSDVFSSHPPATATPTPNLESVLDLGLPTAEPASTPDLSSVIGHQEVPTATPTSNPDSAVDLGLEPPPSVSASGWLGYSSSRRLAAEAPPEEATPEAEAVPPSTVSASGWLGYSSSRRTAAEAAAQAETPPAAAVTPVAEEIPAEPPAVGHIPTGRSSFDFVLPEGVKSFSDMPAPLTPDAHEATDTHAALPARPETRRVDSQTFDMIDLADIEEVPGSGVGLPPAASAPVAEPPAPTTPAPSAPLLTPTEGVIHLPPTYDPEAVLGNLEPIDPVAPASGWLDSDVLTIPSVDPNALVPTAEPAPGQFDPVPADIVESSDIFSGNRIAAALPVEQSDVIAATAYGDATPGDAGRPVEPVEPPRLSDVALTFDGPPGGSTLPDGASAELPVADEVPGSDVLVTPAADSESIHDMPDPASADLLFDSAKLAETPDLPEVPAAEPVPPPRATRDDVPDYGVTPLPSADASSILADLNEPFGLPGEDSSSVRVEAPGVERTLTGSPAEGAFELTVSDEPVPADLFDAASEGTVTISTDWQSQSGSDLFAEGRTTPEVDLGADSGATVEPVDAELTGDQPSLTSAPSSIFSADQPPPTDSGSAGSGNVQIGEPESPSDLAEAELVEVEFVEAEPVVADLSDADFADAAEFSPNPTLGDTAEREKSALPPMPPKTVHKASSGDFELPAEAPPAPAAPVEDDGGAIDWDAAAILQDDDNATRGIPKDASLSAIMRELADDSAETSTRDARPLAPAEIEVDDGTPMVTVDWMASSAEGSAVTEAQAEEAKASPAKPKEKTKDRREQEREQEKPKGKPKASEKKPAALLDADESEEAPKARPRVKPTSRTDDDSGTREKSKPTKKGGGMLVGLLVGGVLAGGAAAGVYFGGLVPNSEKQTAGTQKPDGGGGTNPGDQGNAGNPPQNPPPAANDAQTALAAGDITKALELVKAKTAATTEEKAVAGSVRVFAKLQELGKTGAATAAADDADLALARTDLKAVANDPEAAKSPAAEKRSVAAMVQLGVSYEVAGNTAEARKVFTEGKAKFPKHAAVFDALIDRLDATEKGPGTSFRTRLTPEDAQRLLFATTVLLAADPVKAEDAPEAGLYYWKAVNNAAAGKYPEAIKLIGEAKAAHVKRAKALAGRGLNPLTDPLEQMFPRSCDELASYWKLREELYKNPAIAAVIKKDGVAKTLDALVKAQSDLVTAKADLTTAKADVAKLEKDAAKLEKDATAAKDEVAKLDKELKKATADKLTAELVHDAALKAKQKEKDDLLAALVAELKPAKVLPEKWTPADVVAGVKTVAGLASGADAQRVVKAEAAAKAAQVAAKVATDKLAVETKAFKEKYDTDTAKLKTDHAAELKKLTDTYAADLKKLNDENTAAVKKIKDDNAAEMKKAADKFALDAKKLTETYLAAEKKLKEDNEAAVKKLKEDSAAAIKAEQAKTEAEKKAAALKEISFQKQLANSVTPAQELDVWLPMLTDLRRVSDADPAMATAARALVSALPESEDAAKAHTVNGMGFLLKGNFPAARDEFQAARKNPAYTAAKDKAAWARAADAGLEAVADPLAPYRMPVVVPPVDARAAAKSLDAGIAAYKAGKYEAAATALADAAKNDPTDPVAWYYLGAARWATGDTKQAEKDISQGAEREKVSPVRARVLSAALAPIQGAPRDLIDKARP